MPKILIRAWRTVSIRQAVDVEVEVPHFIFKDVRARNAYGSAYAAHESLAWENVEDPEVINEGGVVLVDYDLANLPHLENLQ